MTRYHWQEGYLSLLLKCEILRVTAFYESSLKSQLNDLEQGKEFNLDASLKQTYQEKAVATIYAYRMLANQGVYVRVKILTSADEPTLMPFKKYLDMLQTNQTEHPDMVWYPPNFDSYDEYQDWFLKCFEEENERVAQSA